jgi:hypothetical protein
MPPTEAVPAAAAGAGAGAGAAGGPPPGDAPVPIYKQWWFWVGLLVILAVLGAIIWAATSGDDDDSPSDTVAPTSVETTTTVEETTTTVEETTTTVEETTTTAAETTVAPTTPPTAPPTTIPVDPSAPAIPGITLEDALTAIANQGWDCAGPIEGGGTIWACTAPETDALLSLYSEDGTALNKVEGQVASEDDYPLLVALAGLPYDGATPDEAQQWTDDNLPTVTPASPATTTFAEVPYVLVAGPAQVRTLEIGQPLS